MLATTKRDGSTQLSPVTVGVDGDAKVVISSRETAFKVCNLRRNAQAELCVMRDEFYGPWLQLSGFANILSLPGAMEPLVDYYRSLSGEHPDWDDYRAVMVRDQRCLIRISVTRAGPDQSG